MIDLAERFPEIALQQADDRPSIQSAIASDPHGLERALMEAKQRDREYWERLKRRAKSGGRWDKI